jgi:WD40 repeat protein
LEKLEVTAALPKSQSGIETLDFSPDRHLIAAGNADGTIEVWDVTRHQRIAEWQGHQLEVTGIGFMPDDKRLVTASLDATVKLWDIETHREPLKSFSRTLNAFFSLTITPDGQRIAAGSWGGLIHMWSSSTGLELATFRTGDWNPAQPQQLVPADENTLISRAGGAVRVWRAPSFEEIDAAEQARTNGRSEASKADIK